MFFGKYTAHIEILRDDNLFRQYFLVLPHCLCLEKSIKRSFEKNFNMESANAKVSSLAGCSLDLIDRLQYEDK